MRDELRFHLDAYTDDLIRSGVPRAEAERLARLEFGGVETVRDECRQARGLRWIDDVRGDLRYGWRALRRNPGFAAAAILSLGLGIGANTAIFSLIDTLLLKSLPVTEPNRLFFVDNSGGKSDGSNGPPYPLFDTLRTHNRYLAGVAAFNPERFKVTIDGASEQVAGQYASGNLFDVLGVTPAFGRLLTTADDVELGRGGRDGTAAVISNGFWRRRFDRDPGVLGKAIQVGPHWVTIVGVTPPEFFGLEKGSHVDITVPITVVGSRLAEKQAWWFSVVGRLKDGASVEQARADLDAMFQKFMTEIGITGEARKYFDRIELVPAQKGLNDVRRRFSRPLLIVMTIVGLVLLIGCANVANLLLARATARRNEMAIRLAIGAGTGRLVRQLLTEGLLLVALGALVATIFARWGVTFLVGFMAGPGESLVLDTSFDVRVLGFTAIVSVLTTLLLSLAPAMQVRRIDAAKPGDVSRVSGLRERFALARTLVVVQVMLSLVLLCGAALFIGTLLNVRAVDGGFQREGILTMRVESVLPRPTGDARRPADVAAEHARITGMWDLFLEKVGTLPGVQSAAAGTLSPLNGRDRGVRLFVVGGPRRAERDHDIHLNQVTPGYFGTLGIQLISGRAFTAQDRPASARVTILNETAARFYFGNANALGSRVQFSLREGADIYEVVGVARDTRYESLRKPSERMAYVPVAQPIDRIGAMTLAVRTSEDASRIVPAIIVEARRAVTGGFVTDVATHGQRVDQALVQERLIATLAAFFGVLALVLACIGLYGVMSYAVIRRSREIGIRMAMGAQPAAVLWLVLRETLALITVGLGIGLPMAVAAARYVESELFELTPGDPVALSAALAVLLSVALAAGYLPARRASRVDPVVTLRCE